MKTLIVVLLLSIIVFVANYTDIIEEFCWEHGINVAAIGLSVPSWLLIVVIALLLRRAK